MTSINTAVSVARWWQKLSEESNACYLPLFFDEHRYLVLKGGGGSGKSIFAGRKIIERCRSEAGHRILVLRKVQKTLRESCFRQLVGQLRQYYPDERVKVNKSDMLIEFENGSIMIFAGLDDVEKLKSIYNITCMWIEEASEITEEDFNQLDIRLRGETAYYKQIIITFNPISILHWLKKRFFDNRDERAYVSETTYKDNRFLDAEAVRVLEHFREVDEYYYTVYCLGEWGVTGRTVFDGRAVSERLAKNIQPVLTGVFAYDYDGIKIENMRFDNSHDGFIRIYKKPEKGVPYVIGGDTAGEGSDSFVAQVIDNRSGEQVAILRHRTDEDMYARQVYCLGMYYNTALVAVETNFSTYPTMELERLRYPKLYVRESVDDYTHAIRRAYGFRTDSKTRPVAIATLITAMRDDPSIVSDRTTLEEMLTFVRSESFRPEAEEGAHDDCIMALAIAHFTRPQQSYLAEIEEIGKVWTRSQWEDYDNASQEERAYLIKKWGKPRRS